MMAFNNSRNYNTRHSGRYNRPGSFIPATSTNHQTFDVPKSEPVAAPAPAPQLPEPVPQPDLIKNEDVEMEGDQTAAAGEKGSRFNHPFFKTKLAGVKKISNKERRRRQNALLRRLTTPKNALMCINEMLPNEQVANQFKVEPAPSDSLYYNHGTHNFCAELLLEGITYKGYGENKLAARNAAAEQAIRDIVLRKMERYSEAQALAAANEENGAEGAAAVVPLEGGAEGEGEALPMIQLLSFALHKLFAEWEGAGHHVPQLRPNKSAGPSQSLGEEDMPLPALGPAAPGSGGAAPGPRVKKERKVPDNASSMHPAMLLTVLRPTAAYREISAEGDKPQNMIFTIGVEVDGQTYIGKASNKKEARKNAARSACKAILGITFDDEKLTN